MARRTARTKPPARASSRAKAAGVKKAAPRARRVSPIPSGYHSVTPYLTVHDGVAALDFYRRAFGAREKERMPGPGGKIMHAELTLGGSVVMLSDELPGSTCRSPKSLGGTTGSIFLYVPDVDAAFKRATDAGCTSLMPPTDMFWGDRFARLEDPFGNQWGMATHKEDLTMAQIAAREGGHAAGTGRAMRDVHVSAITDAVKKLCVEANYQLEPDMLRAFDRALATERSAAGKQVLQILKQNAEMARTKMIPYCQDTGTVICFVELGQDVHVTGGALSDAINAGVSQGYTEGYLRASMVRSPIDRVNTGDNTPAVIHTDVVPGAALRILVMAKGGGCENRSKYKMLTPADGLQGVKDWVLECVRTAGPDACPPLVLGVGVGGNFEKSAILSKRALFRELGSPNPDPTLDALEKELLDRANRLGIGPQGYGGDTTAFGIHVLAYPCHITSLPVSVTIECHAHRHKEVTL
ncbi:MAG: fumarate hydratase [Candidatus Rokubacteria bacterium]|nr:fumarate hydratase [Candidatus Rokubacteria bacterium]MBI3826692.1 fumarate hydratase [Candidatus Rokubacteria bacterium]